MTCSFASSAPMRAAATAWASYYYPWEAGTSWRTP